MGDAVVLAGGKSDQTLSKISPYKACLTINGEVMVLPIVRALLEAPSTERVFVLGKIDILKQIDFPCGITIADGGETILDALRRATKLVRSDRPFLLASCDIPLLTAGGGEYIWQLGAREKADLLYPIVREERMAKAYPHNRKTYVRLADGSFTGGNILYAEGTATEEIFKMASRLFASRKRPWRLASIFGWRFLLSFLLRRLTVQEVTCHITTVWKRRCVGMIVPYPEIAMDVDRSSDLELVKRYMK